MQSQLRPDRLVTALIIVVLLATTGCKGPTKLPYPPYVLINEGPVAFESTPEAFRHHEMPIFYVTDRLQQPGDGPVKYGYNRNHNLVYGVATVGMTPEPSWDELVTASTTVTSRPEFVLQIESIEPKGSITSTAERLEVRDDRLYWTDEQRAAFFKEGELMREHLAPWIDAGATEAVVYVHGFNNTFEDAVTRVAGIWHYTGRTMIPIAYTWPAGSGGGLLGYTQDRESSEFTVTHLKMFLLLLSMHPQLERVHIVAHSRGTDVASTAIREMHMSARGTDETLRERIKLGSLVLAAPDLDVDVFTQRFLGEEAAEAPERMIVYVSKKDKAIGLSNWLFGSRERLGRLSFDEIGPKGRQLLTDFRSLQLINCQTVGFGSTHNYAFEHPAVSSDLVLVLRDKAEPDGERALDHGEAPIWLIRNRHMQPESVQLFQHSFKFE